MQDNGHGLDTRALLHHHWRSCIVCHLINVSPTRRPNSFSRVLAILCLVAVCFCRNTGICIILLTVGVDQFVRSSHTALFLPPFLAVVRVYVCAFLTMSVPAFRFLYVSHGCRYFTADSTHATAFATSLLRTLKMKSRSPCRL